MPRIIPLRRHLFFLSLALCCLVLSAPRAAAQTSPQAFDELWGRAEAQTAAKQWVEAAALWEKVVEANPVEGRFWDRLANAYYNAKEYRKAIPAY